MEELVRLIREALGECPLVANVTWDMEECATYDVTTIGYDGIKRTVSLKVRIFTETLLRGLELEDALDRTLVHPDDRRRSETILRCARNGGGWINDGDRHCRIAYYEVLLSDPNTDMTPVPGEEE